MSLHFVGRCNLLVSLVRHRYLVEVHGFTLAALRHAVRWHVCTHPVGFELPKDGPFDLSRGLAGGEQHRAVQVPALARC